MNTTNYSWPHDAKKLAIELHSSISINDGDWHTLKGNRKRRAAEMLSGAIVQLILGGKINDVEKLIEQSLKWLRNEIHAPNCPDAKSKVSSNS